MALAGASHQKLDLLNGQGHIRCLFANHDQNKVIIGQSDLIWTWNVLLSPVWDFSWFVIIVVIAISVVIVIFIMCTLTIRRRRLRSCARIRDWDLWGERGD